MLRLDRDDADASRLVIRVGQHRIPLAPPAVSDLAAFLEGDAVERIWASPAPTSVAGLEFRRADGTHLAQHARDLRRRRVILHHGRLRWHLLPTELDALRVRLAAFAG
jgi:hypothetical protein